MSHTAADSPMMRQWQTLKSSHPGCLLLFRMGDFYETFMEDARVAARSLGITLTSRGKSSGQDFPLAGFPHQKLEPYLARLVRAGLKVAVAEQVEDPRQAKGLVEREVTRIVTAGTLTEESLLDERANNYLAAVIAGRPARGQVGAGLVGLAFADLSTGEFGVMELLPGKMTDELARLAPAECVVPADASGCARADELAIVAAPGSTPGVVSTAPEWSFSPDRAREELLSHFRVANLAGYGCEDLTMGMRAAGALIAYLRETQMTALSHIVGLVHHRPGSRMTLDRATMRTLELTQTMRDGLRKGSLLDVLDRTRTAMGARLLRAWLLEPLVELDAIEERQDAVAELVENDGARERARDELSRVQDLERLAARITTGRASARDLLALRDSARALPGLAGALAPIGASLCVRLAAGLGALDAIEADVAASLADDAPANLREGGLIRAGASDELDELRSVCERGDDWIARFQEQEIARTGIGTLKVGYNSVFGYYIEVTHANVERVPAEYVRKQTLKNAERYITPTLKAYENEVLGARERASALEYRIFEELRARVAERMEAIVQTARAVATIDVLASLGEQARRARWVRPQIDDSRRIDIRAGRHPVLEALLSDGSFVPNDLLLDEEQRVIVLTGPNMAGKSTYIRQAALLVLLAQIGSFVPADRAQIGVVDRIFTRIGAADELSRGASTFMVEMNETASILNHATDRSLVILDEVGRGTSTYDGVSIAWAVTEHLHDAIGARTLFATHYHELAELGDQLPHLANLNVAVVEEGDEVVFLHRIQAGGADKSYGIHVARLAGIPDVVVDRARQILESLHEGSGEELRARLAAPAPGTQGFLFAPPRSAIEERLRKVDVDELTPRQAMQLLYELRSLLDG